MRVSWSPPYGVAMDFVAVLIAVAFVAVMLLLIKGIDHI
jgi:hypothetical protein